MSPDAPAGLPGDATALDAPVLPEDGVMSEDGVLSEDEVAELLEVDDPAHPGHSWAVIVSWVVVGLTCVFVFASLSPQAILSTATPTGGDMGAHVWGPAFLRDHLLPQFRLTGWTPDWYAGFPAYVFYMVIPSLVIVMINVGPPIWLSPFLLAGLGALAWLVKARVRSSVLRTAAWVVLAMLAVLSVPVPYEVAFKLVTVSGLVTLPLAAFALARSFRLPFPGPAIVAVGAAAFLYETGYTILGGNITSTMAGEFAFSISLTLCVLYLAVLVRGVRTGRDMALAATLFGLVILCHIIPAMFAVVATAIFVITRREDRTPWWDGSRPGRWVAGVLVAVSVATLVDWASLSGGVTLPTWVPSLLATPLEGLLEGVGSVLQHVLGQHLFPIVVTLVVLALFGSIDLRAATFSSIAVPVGGLITCFWFVPFVLDSAFMNDMGWEKYTQYADYLWPQTAQFDMPYRNVVFTLAAIGVVLSILHRQRIGWFLTMVVVGMAWAFRYAPQWRLWNARILPFYFLALYLLAAVAVALLVRSIALVVAELMSRREEPVGVGIAGVAIVTVVVAVVIGGALRILPGGRLATDATGTSVYQWMGFTWHKLNPSASWARYNYEGLEARDAYPELRQIVDTMGQVGRTDGCGRAMWEYEPKLDRFGTPMALMLLPYFTHGCIGSMEGLYFEASSTTPFHFLNQSELSMQPSRAQRDLPYGGLDMRLGISHLQMLGVKYYMATSEQAIAAARQDPRLTELRTIRPKPTADGVRHEWVVFEVADADLVVPLRFQPVVLKDTDDHIDGWVYGKERSRPAPGQEIGTKTAGPAVTWYLDPTRWDVPLATSGPSNWKRVAPTDSDPPRVAVPQATVTNVRDHGDSISFDVDRVGTPVLIRTSFFPNWQADGATGPYRVSPNLMVVVPTSKHVTVAYGTTGADRLGWALTVLGLVLVVLLAVWDERSRSSRVIERVGAWRPLGFLPWARSAAVDPPVGAEVDGHDGPRVGADADGDDAVGEPSVTPAAPPPD
ncbi:MAG: hypothetical protein JST64_15555 [Actinobacteria bacterium]|nr:hypothetical protein [Actinomycetota bacterium]